MTKRVLVTGSSGYIGQHLCKMLKARGDIEVHGLDKVVNHTNVDKFYELDITKPISGDVDFHTVIHLAALVNVGESVNRPDQYYTTNLLGTINLLGSVSCGNFVFASTGAAVDCQSPYGTSKRAAEDMVRFLRGNAPHTIFRFYNVIGSDGIEPTNPDGLFYNLIKSVERGSFTIYGNDYNTLDGTCVRDYVHVNEICQALITAIDQSSTQIENLGHGRGHSVKEIVELFKKVNNVDFEVGFGPRRAGDLESSVLQTVSPYMKQMYSIEDLLRYNFNE